MISGGGVGAERSIVLTSCEDRRRRFSTDRAGSRSELDGMPRESKADEVEDRLANGECGFHIPGRGSLLSEVRGVVAS